jgi:hypothetical protein
VINAGFSKRGSGIAPKPAKNLVCRAIYIVCDWQRVIFI